MIHLTNISLTYREAPL